MRIKRLAGTAVIAVVALIVTGCGSDDEGAVSPPAAAADASADASAEAPAAVTGGPLEVGVLTAKDTPGMKFWEATGDELEQSYPGTKMTFTFANTDARPAMEQRWRSGKGPDVDYGMFDGTNAALMDWASEGDLLDLTPYLQQKDPDSGKTWLDTFNPAVRKFMQMPDEGKYYGVPTELSAEVLFYNAKIFKDNNIAPPATWDELLTAVDALKSAGVDPIAVSGMIEPYMGMWSDYLWAREVGYAKTHEVLTEGKGSISDDPGFLAGLTKIQELRDKDAFLRGFEGTDFTAVQTQFFQGKAGMILMGSWLVSEMKAVIPKDFDLGVVAFPTIDGANGDQEAMLGTMQNISINANSANVPLAVEWAKLVTSEKVQTDRAKATGEVSAVLGVPSPEGMPGIDKLVAGAGSLNPSYYGLLQSKANDVVYPEIAKLFFGKQDADATLAAIDTGLKRVYGN
ncbi:ABC transporter substrate-binding protein [Nakamurella lactea]|uniref:ABC transporter substrate-binding protein n=1 Tax=Nakamurella lactea TaxID=459515 RepID=UPI00041CC2D8|nr:extracellular solute-binding protein [Nakamurella lactea]